MDKAEGSKLKGIVYLRTVGEADDLVQEIEVTFLQFHLHAPSVQHNATNVTRCLRKAVGKQCRPSDHACSENLMGQEWVACSYMTGLGPLSSSSMCRIAQN